jgi:hypothetical protein
VGDVITQTWTFTSCPWFPICNSGLCSLLGFLGLQIFSSILGKLGIISLVLLMAGFAFGVDSEMSSIHSYSFTLELLDSLFYKTYQR